VKVSIPSDFVLSERVKAWAATKGFDRLTEHFEAFVHKAVANGYRYADWDAALMAAIQADWAGLRNGKGSKSPRTHDGKNFTEGTVNGRIV
jgi:hypothetical protein